MNNPIIIFVNPGHGGRDSGAVGAGGSMEKTVVLTVGQRLRSLFKRNYPTEINCILFRSADSFFSPAQIARSANEQGADLFLSIHANAGGGFGFEAFTSPGKTAADPFATSLLTTYQQEFPNRKMRTDLRDGDPDKEARFTVLKNTDMPAVLFELGFIDTPAGEQFLTTPDNQDRMAQALYAGTINYLQHIGALPSPAPEVEVGEIPLPFAEREGLIIELQGIRSRISNHVQENMNLRNRLLDVIEQLEDG